MSEEKEEDEKLYEELREATANLISVVKAYRLRTHAAIDDKSLDRALARAGKLFAKKPEAKS